MVNTKHLFNVVTETIYLIEDFRRQYKLPKSFSCIDRLLKILKLLESSCIPNNPLRQLRQREHTGIMQADQVAPIYNVYIVTTEQKELLEKLYEPDSLAPNESDFYYTQSQSSLAQKTAGLITNKTAIEVNTFLECTIPFDIVKTFLLNLTKQIEDVFQIYLSSYTIHSFPQLCVTNTQTLTFGFSTNPIEAESLFHAALNMFDSYENIITYLRSNNSDKASHQEDHAAYNSPLFKDRYYPCLAKRDELFPDTTGNPMQREWQLENELETFANAENTRATTILKKAATMGHPQAMMIIGFMQLTGVLSIHHPLPTASFKPEALETALQTLTSVKPFIQDMIFLCNVANYLNEIGETRLAVDWYFLAIKNGNHDSALNALRILYTTHEDQNICPTIQQEILKKAQEFPDIMSSIDQIYPTNIPTF